MDSISAQTAGGGSHLQDDDDQDASDLVSDLAQDDGGDYDAPVAYGWPRRRGWHAWGAAAPPAPHAAYFARPAAPHLGSSRPAAPHFHGEPGYPHAPGDEPEMSGWQDPHHHFEEHERSEGRRRGLFDRLLGRHPQQQYPQPFRPSMPGISAAPYYGQPQPPRPGAPIGPNAMNSFARWIQVHGNSPTAAADYAGWWAQNGVNGATINGEDFGVDFGDEDDDGDLLLIRA